MPTSKFVVMISSTAIDLPEHRNQVMEACNRCSCDYVCMESLPASNDDAVKESMALVDKADIYIGILANRYGSGITELEYDRAEQRGIPRLLFYIADNHPITIDMVETGPGLEKLKAFKARLKPKHVKAYFKSPEDLRAHVLHALPEATKKLQNNDKEKPDLENVQVTLITDHRSVDLVEALSIFSQRIPQNEQFEAEDIIRWIREDQEAVERGERGRRDYFFVAKTGAKVGGFILSHFHSDQSLAFIAYLVARKGHTLSKGTIAATLLRSMTSLFSQDKYLQPCKGFLLEVDDPRLASSRREYLYRIARINLFCTLAQANGLSLRAIDIEYRQPRLTLPSQDSSGGEIPMILMYATKKTETHLSREEVASLLTYIYLHLYPEGFSQVTEENEAYLAYTTKFCDEQIDKLPQRIATLNYSQLKKKTRRIFSGSSR